MRVVHMDVKVDYTWNLNLLLGENEIFDCFTFQDWLSFQIFDYVAHFLWRNSINAKNE